MRGKLVAAIKGSTLDSGMLLEKFTFDEWIRHIEELD